VVYVSRFAVRLCARTGYIAFNSSICVLLSIRRLNSPYFYVTAALIASKDRTIIYTYLEEV
jgi:hypothetical protein